MNHFEYRDGALCCEEVKLADIADAVGTPAYVYSTATLERHYDVFRAAFAPREVLVAFAVKANANIAVLATLARKGAGADTVSQGEIERALRARVPADKIIFSGVGKTEAELAFAVQTGVHQINLESIAELETLSRIAWALQKQPAIAIRVNPDVHAGGHEKISTGKGDAKFGVSPDQALALYARATDDKHLDAKGLAVHIGSQIRDLAPLEAAFRVMRSLAERLRSVGIAIERLDLGGGLGVPYFNEPDPPAPAEYAAMAERVFAGFDIALSFEPGRMIAANAGVLISRVVRLQDRPRPIVVLDAAMNDLIRPAIYDAYHEIRPARLKGDTHSSAPARQGIPASGDECVSPTAYDVVGPICETGDTFARNRMLAPVQEGDLVAFMTAGAYGAVMASTYNARPLLPEVLVRGDKFEVVRRRWEVADQLKLERLPPWLEEA
ncbi:MAG: diaminopimelate decarboxylase [Caulobacteraceae bacterium]